MKGLSYDLASENILSKFKKRSRSSYRNVTFEVGFRADLIVNSRVLIEVKAIDQLLPVHHAQVITYLKLTGLRTGLLINFNVPLLRDGLKRITL